MSEQFAIGLVITGDIDDDLMRRFHDRFDGELATIAGRTTVRVYAAGGDPVAVARQVIADVETLGVAVVDVDLDLVNMTEIADRLGSRTRQNVRQLITGERGRGGFPLPLGSPGGVRVWDWGTVNRWFRETFGEGDAEQPLTWRDAAQVSAWLAGRAPAYR